jgi:hypothetical protein
MTKRKQVAKDKRSPNKQRSNNLISSQITSNHDSVTGLTGLQQLVGNRLVQHLLTNPEQEAGKILQNQLVLFPSVAKARARRVDQYMLQGLSNFDQPKNASAGETKRISDATMSHPTNTFVIQRSVEDDIRQQLERRFREEDVEGLQDRRQQLREVFRSIEPSESRELYERLRTRQETDDLSKLFHDRLATATRREMLGILQSKLSASQQAATAESPDDLTRFLDGLTLETISISPNPILLDSDMQSARAVTITPSSRSGLPADFDVYQHLTIELSTSDGVEVVAEDEAAWPLAAAQGFPVVETIS